MLVALWQLISGLHYFAWLLQLDTTLSHGEGGFWVTLSKSNVLFWAILCSYSESQLFLSLIVQVDIIFQDYIRGTPSIVEFIKQALGL